jgi:hypothetical protein
MALPSYDDLVADEEKLPSYEELTAGKQATQVTDNHSPEWRTVQATMAKEAVDAGLPHFETGRDRLIDALSRSEKSGFPVTHFAGQPNEPTGDRAPARDIESLVGVLKRRESITTDPIVRTAVSNERQYWEKQVAQGMTAQEWTNQTGEPDLRYPNEIPAGALPNVAALKAGKIETAPGTPLIETAIGSEIVGGIKDFAVGMAKGLPEMTKTLMSGPTDPIGFIKAAAGQAASDIAQARSFPTAPLREQVSTGLGFAAQIAPLAGVLFPEGGAVPKGRLSSTIFPEKPPVQVPVEAPLVAKDLGVETLTPQETVTPQGQAELSVVEPIPERTSEISAVQEPSTETVGAQPVRTESVREEGRAGVGQDEQGQEVAGAQAEEINGAAVQPPEQTAPVSSEGQGTVATPQPKIPELKTTEEAIAHGETPEADPVALRAEHDRLIDQSETEKGDQKVATITQAQLYLEAAETAEKNPQTPTGIRNKIVDREREARGLAPAMTEARRSFGDVWDKTLQKIDDNPRAQDDLIAELKQKPRAVTDEEDAMLLHRQIDLQNQFNKTSESVIKAQELGDTASLTENRVRFAQLSDELLDLYNVGRKAGTETARGLAARKMLANEDFSLARMTQQKRAANEGRPLNEAEADNVRTTQSKIADAQKTLDDYLAEREMQFAEKQEARKAASIKASKTRLEAQAGELEQRISWQDLEKQKREPIQLDEEGLKLKSNVERLKQQFQQELTKDMLSKRTPLEKFQDTFVKWRRGFILSSPNVFAKLTSAAAQRMVITPAEEAIGGVYSKLLPELARKAPREGGFSAKAEAKAITEGFTKGMKDSWDVLRTGKSSLDVAFGKRGYLPPEAIDFIGHTHGALKTVPKRAEFARSFQKRTESAIANGVDASDPLVQSRIAIEAYKDANRTIFLQDNRVVSAYKRFLSAFDQPSKETGKVPLASKAVGTTARVLLPIVKVPTNIIAETLQYATGSVTGSVRLGRAFAKGFSNLQPEEAEIIMRSLKKGSLGTAVMALGYFNADKVGGYYQPGKREKSDVKFGSVKVFGTNIPSYFLHVPLLECLQIGATVRRVADSKLKKSDTATQGVPAGVLAAGLGITEEVPFVREMLEVSKAFHPNERGAFIGELTKSLAVPQAVEWTARQMDKTPEGEVRKRKPEGVVEHIETAIPGLRQNVPEKTEKKARKRE